MDKIYKCASLLRYFVIEGLSEEQLGAVDEMLAGMGRAV